MAKREKWDVIREPGRGPDGFESRFRPPNDVLAAIRAIQAGEIQPQPPARRSAAHASYSPPPATVAPDAPDAIAVPVFDQPASAGYGADALPESPTSTMSFDCTWLRQYTQVAPHRLALIPVAGSSMEPDLYDGDLVFIDRGDVHTLREGVYVFALHGSIFVKRLVLRGTALIVVSSNSHFEAVELATMREEPTFRLIGRVIGKPEIRRF